MQLFAPKSVNYEWAYELAVLKLSPHQSRSVVGGYSSGKAQAVGRGRHLERFRLACDYSGSLNKIHIPIYTYSIEYNNKELSILVYCKVGWLHSDADLIGIVSALRLNLVGDLVPIRYQVAERAPECHPYIL